MKGHSNYTCSPTMFPAFIQLTISSLLRCLLGLSDLLSSKHRSIYLLPRILHLSKRSTIHSFAEVRNSHFPSLFYTPYSFHYQIFLPLSSKYIFHLNIFLDFCCDHPSSSHMFSLRYSLIAT